MISIQPDSLKVMLIGLGLGVGDVFTLSDIAPFGDPLALRTESTKIAIRKEDAAQIEAELIP